MMFPMTGLGGLPRLRDFRSKRISSYDRSGGNHDWVDVPAGQRMNIAEIDGPGCIRHIWMTMWYPEDKDHNHHLRRTVLRFYWDGASEPSIECPIGDFFGLGHARRKNFVTAVLQMSPQDGRGFNCYWPMPFRRHARIEIENPGPGNGSHYFYVDYETYADAAAVEGLGYLHVQWRRENGTIGWGDEHTHLLREGKAEQWRKMMFEGGDPRSLNLSSRDNYVILETQGDGIYCGAHLDIDIFEPQKNPWYGEGDDMIFIDDEPWPPSIHGTGTEDWNNCAFGPNQEYQAPYHGILLYTGTPDFWPTKWIGKQSIYRYHVEDPVRFRKSIHVSIEHGHANKLNNDYSSTAYYYLASPMRGGPALPPVEGRLPRPD
jgi:hypothetical protein